MAMVKCCTAILAVLAETKPFVANLTNCLTYNHMIVLLFEFCCVTFLS